MSCCDAATRRFLAARTNVHIAGCPVLSKAEPCRALMAVGAREGEPLECIVVSWRVRVLFSLADLISSICGNKTDLSQRSTCLKLSLSDFILRMLISSFSISLIIAPVCILEHFRTNSCSSVQRSPEAVGLFQPTNPIAAVAAAARCHPVSL